MPFYTGKDKKGNWVKWGKLGNKYYYKPFDKSSRKAAETRALNAQKSKKRRK